jgi:hypothetical protein
LAVSTSNTWRGLAPSCTFTFTFTQTHQCGTPLRLHLTICGRDVVILYFMTTHVALDMSPDRNLGRPSSHLAVSRHTSFSPWVRHLVALTCIFSQYRTHASRADSELSVRPVECERFDVTKARPALIAKASAQVRSTAVKGRTQLTCGKYASPGEKKKSRRGQG